MHSWCWKLISSTQKLPRLSHWTLFWSWTVNQQIKVQWDSLGSFWVLETGFQHQERMQHQCALLYWQFSFYLFCCCAPGPAGDESWGLRSWRTMWELDLIRMVPALSLANGSPDSEPKLEFRFIYKYKLEWNLCYKTTNCGCLIKRITFPL